MADRVRRVSFLVDLGAGTAEERAQVRLVLSRVLTHLSRQSPAPPRWSFRFYDSSLTPQRFDARMHARAKASSAVDPKLGAAASLRRDEFHACTPDAIAAVLRQYDQAVELYNAADAEGANHVGTPPEHPGDPVDGPDSAERTGWFTTLARQMAGVIQRAAGELAGMTGDGDGGGSERQHSAVVILARVRGDAPAPSNDENDPSAQPPRTGTEVDFLRPFKGIEDAYRKENTRAYLLRLGTSPSSRETLRRASELFARFGGSSAPVAAVAHTCSCLPPGLLMSAFARVKPHRGGHGTTPDGNDGNDRPLGSFVLSARRHATELWVRRTDSQTTSEKKSESSSDSSSVRLGAIAVLPCDEPGYHGRSIRGIRRVTIASLASADQLAACWVRTGGRRMGKIPGKRDGVGGAFGGGVGTSIAVAAKGSAAYALGALLAIRRAGAIVELEVECEAGGGPHSPSCGAAGQLQHGLAPHSHTAPEPHTCTSPSARTAAGPSTVGPSASGPSASALPVDVSVGWDSAASEAGGARGGWPLPSSTAQSDADVSSTPSCSCRSPPSPSPRPSPRPARRT